MRLSVFSIIILSVWLQKLNSWEVRTFEKVYFRHAITCWLKVIKSKRFNLNCIFTASGNCKRTRVKQKLYFASAEMQQYVKDMDTLSVSIRQTQRVGGVALIRSCWSCRGCGPLKFPTPADFNKTPQGFS